MMRRNVPGFLLIIMAMSLTSPAWAGEASCEYYAGTLYCRLTPDFDGVIDSWMSGSTLCGTDRETLYAHVKANVLVINGNKIYWRWFRVENGWVNHRQAHYNDLIIQNCRTSKQWWALAGRPVVGTNRTLGLYYLQDAYPSCGSILQLYATWGESADRDDPPSGLCQTALTIWLEVQ